MRKFVPTALFVLFSAGAYVAQIPTPSTSPAPDDVVKISTNLIQLDVTVTDRKGKPVADLRADEIEIYENGEKQQITNFSYVSVTRSPAAKPPPPDPDAAPVPPVTLRPENVRRTVALVVDDLTLSFESAHYTRRALKQFVDEQMQPGDLVAIVRTGAGIGALQQFTSDKRILYAAIDKVKWNPMGTGGISAFAPINEEPSAEASVDTEADESATESLEDFRGRVFATGTLGALRFVVSGMRELPGRKSVILFSQGFRLVEQSGGFLSTGTVLDFVKILVDEATRSSVVFYAVDPRGLVYTGPTTADSVSNPAAISSIMSGRSRELQDTQDGLKYLTRETGGFAIVNNNDLSSGVRRVLEDQSYYLVGYIPESDTFDPANRKFNKIEVKVRRPDTTVRYRSGFINVAERERPAAAVAVAGGSALSRLRSALVSPFAVNAINLKLNALFGLDPKGGSFVKSVLHVDAADMQFTDDKDGVKKAGFDVLAASFGDNGQIVDQLGRSYAITLKPDDYKRLLADGFVYHFTFPVRKPGAFQYRVALRDTGSGRIGSASQFVDVKKVNKDRPTLSSLVIENFSAADWEKMAAGEISRPSDPMSDTAQRRINPGTVLRYGLEIYNAKLGGDKLPQLTVKTRVFRDGQVVMDGVVKDFDLTGQTEMRRLKLAGAVSMGGKMEPGDYILQVIVTDKLAKKKQQIATQFIQFEVVE